MSLLLGYDTATLHWFVCPTVSMVTTAMIAGLEKTLFCVRNICGGRTIDPYWYHSLTMLLIVLRSDREICNRSCRVLNHIYLLFFSSFFYCRATSNISQIFQWMNHIFHSNFKYSIHSYHTHNIKISYTQHQNFTVNATRHNNLIHQVI